MQRAINMHTSQISHGLVPVADFSAIGLNVLVTGYTPSMIKIGLLDNVLDPVEWFHWYSTDPDFVYSGSGREATIVIPTERGFVLSGVLAVALEAETAAFLWETYGCDNDGDYRNPMNAGPAQAGDAMDPINPHLPDIRFADPDEDDDVDDDDVDDDDTPPDDD